MVFLYHGFWRFLHLGAANYNQLTRVSQAKGPFVPEIGEEDVSGLKRGFVIQLESEWTVELNGIN